jgi:hypothetical protein
MNSNIKENWQRNLYFGFIMFINPSLSIEKKKDRKYSSTNPTQCLLEDSQDISDLKKNTLRQVLGDEELKKFPILFLHPLHFGCERS